MVWEALSLLALGWLAPVTNSVQLSLCLGLLSMLTGEADSPLLNQA